MADFPTPPLFDVPARGTPQNFWMKLTTQKLDGWGYHMVNRSRSRRLTSPPSNFFRTAAVAFNVQFFDAVTEF